MDPTPPPLPRLPVDYGTNPIVQRRPLTSLRQTLMLGFICGILFIELVYVVPLMEQSFKDLKTELPALTQLTIRASHFTRNNVIAWPLFVAVPLFVPMLTSALLWRPGISSDQLRLRRFLLGSLVTSVFALIAVILVVGLFMGYIGMINALTSPGK